MRTKANLYTHVNKQIYACVCICIYVDKNKRQREKDIDIRRYRDGDGDRDKDRDRKNKAREKESRTTVSNRRWHGRRHESRHSVMHTDLSKLHHGRS